MTFSNEILNLLRRKQSISPINIEKILDPGLRKLFYLKKPDEKKFIKSRLELFKERPLDCLKKDSFKTLTEVSNEKAFYFGFVINVNNKIFLYNCLDQSNEMLVELDLITQFKKYALLFTGMIIAVAGCNPNGNLIIVKDIFDQRILFLNEYEIENAHRNKMTISVVSGPFNDQPCDPNAIFASLDFSYIHSDILIILGPIIKNNFFFENDISLDELFYQFEQKISLWLKKSPERKVILIPSSEDVHTLGIYPNDPYKKFSNLRAMMLFGNPVQFRIENVLFSVSTSDLLLAMNRNSVEFHSEHSQTITKDEDKKWPKNSQKIEKLSSHLIYQASFLPVFDSSLQLLSLSDPSVLNIETAPEIFLTCSKLKPFIQKLSGPFAVVNVGSQPNIKNKNVLIIDVNIKQTEFSEKFDMEFRKLL